MYMCVCVCVYTLCVHTHIMYIHTHKSHFVYLSIVDGHLHCSYLLAAEISLF